MLIRNRLILSFTLLVLFIQLGFSVFVYWFYSTSRERRFRDRLAGEAALTARMLVRDHHLDREYLRTFRPRHLPNVEGEQVSLFDPSNQLIYSSADSAGLALHRRYLATLTDRDQVTFSDGPRETVGVAYAYEGRRFLLFTGGIDDYGSAQTHRLRLILLVGNVGALALIILAGWYFADEALRPMAGVVQQVQQITASNLKARVDEGNGTDEIAQLALTFNRMLDGLEQAFESQKSFVAHASHELRTPLATVLGTLETAATYDQTLPEARQSMRVATTEIRRLIGLTNGLLTLARADAGTFTQAATVRLDECLLAAIEGCRERYPAQPVRLSFGHIPDTVEEPFLTRGHAELLTTALLNLLDNACKFSGQAVDAELAYAETNWLIIKIQDHGPGIPPADLRRVFDPLFRGEGGRLKPGHGIGLAITQRVLQLHGGRIVLTSEDGRGTAATVTLPVAT